MSNPHPEPHPENLRPFKKGDKSVVETQRKGARKSTEAQIRKRTMREWAEFYGTLPVKKGKVKDPKTATDLSKGAENPPNLTMDGMVLAAMYNKAMKGDVRAAEYLAKLKGQTTEDVTVHIDAMAQMNTDDLLKLYESTKAKE